MENEKPQIIVKKKNIQQVIDFSLDNGVEFTVKPKLSGDEWVVELNIRDIKTAIVLGIFLKENRLDMVGITPYQPKNNVIVKTTTKTKKSKNDSLNLLQDHISEENEDSENLQEEEATRARKNEAETKNEIVAELKKEGTQSFAPARKSEFETNEETDFEFDNFEIETSATTNTEYNSTNLSEELNEINEEIEAFGSDRNNSVSLF